MTGYVVRQGKTGFHNEPLQRRSRRKISQRRLFGMEWKACRRMELVPDYIKWQTSCKSGVELSMAVPSPVLVCQPANTLSLTLCK